MNKTDTKDKKLNRVQKIQIIIASVLTIAIIIAISVYAWFSLASNMETMTKVKEPDNLDIRAGNFNPIINFDLNGINIEDMAENDHAEYRVFSVSAGDYKIAYKLQLTHTTNIPFKYKGNIDKFVDNAFAKSAFCDRAKFDDAQSYNDYLEAKRQKKAAAVYDHRYGNEC